MKPHNLQLHGQLSLLLCNIGMVCWNYDILYNDGKIPKPKWIIYVRTLVMIKFDCRKIEHTTYESPFLKTRRLALCTSFWICTAHDTVGSGHLSPGSSDWRRAWSASRSPLSWTPAPLEKPPLVCVAISILNKKKEGKFQFLWIEQRKWHVDRRGTFEATCLNQSLLDPFYCWILVLCFEMKYLHTEWP